MRNSARSAVRDHPHQENYIHDPHSDKSRREIHKDTSKRVHNMNGILLESKMTQLSGISSLRKLVKSGGRKCT
jgi:hypothetical protein